MTHPYQRHREHHAARHKGKVRYRESGGNVPFTNIPISKLYSPEQIDTLSRQSEDLPKKETPTPPVRQFGPTGKESIDSSGKVHGMKRGGKAKHHA